MAYAGLLDGGLTIMAGCAADWTGGTNITALAHGLEFETTVNGIGGGSFWIEVPDPFDLSAYSWLMHGKRINISHTYDAVTSYLYKGYIVSDPRRGVAGETSRVTVELGGPLDVAKWRTDCAFFFTDADTSENWITNKRNNKVFNCQTGDCVEISVDKGDKVPDNNRGGIIGYVPYLGAQYMIGTAAQNRFNGVRRIDGHISFDLGDNMRARLLAKESGYTDQRNVTSSEYTVLQTWTGKADNRYFDSNGWWSPPTDGVKYLALALYSTPVTGDNNVMNADRFVRIEDCRVYCGTVSRRIDEGMLTIANWLNMHTLSSTENVYSVIPSLFFRPYGSPVDALNEFSLQSDNLMQWGWWPERTSNNVRFRSIYLPTSGIRSGTNCYTVNATVPGVTWDVRPHPEDGQGDVRALRLIYGRMGRRSDWPAGTPNAVIGPGDPGFRNTGGPFQGSSSIVTTVDFSERNFTDEHAKRIAKLLGRNLQGADKMAGSVSSRALALTRTTDSAVFPYAYIQGGDFVVSTQEDANATKPLLVTSCHVDVDNQTVEMDVGLPADGLLRQLEQAGRLGRTPKWNKRRR